jgi:hypothetical protein
VCAAAWLALLPGCFWDSWSRTKDSPANTPISTYLPRSLNWVALAAIVYVLLWNVYTTDSKLHGIWFRPALRTVGNSLGLAQWWNLFAPRPMTNDGWYVTVGEREDGVRVDVFRQGEVHWDRPASVFATYRDDRWRKYLNNLLRSRNAQQRSHFARYLYSDWNARHQGGERLRRVEVYYMLEITPPRRGPVTPRKLLLAVWPTEGSLLVPDVLETDPDEMASP